MGRRHRKAQPKFWGLALALALLAAAAALGVSLFLRAFSSHDLTGYEPKDIQRGEYLEHNPGANR